MGTPRLIEFLRAAYRKNPRIYTLCELTIVVGGIFIILWVLRFCWWGPHLSALTGAVCGLVFISSFFVHKDTLKDLGIRVDNLPRSFMEASIATLFCVVFLVVIFIFLFRESYVPRAPAKVIKDYLLYIVWGTMQQFALNAFLYLRLKKVLGNSDVAVILAAVLFSLIHAPNMGLVIFTAAGGLMFCYLFTRNRNVFSLGVMHGTVATVAFLLLIPGFLRYPTVGPPGLERYDAFGNSPVIGSGDINGDGKQELLATRGPTENGDTTVLVLTGDGALLDRFPAFETVSPYGANLAAGDIDGDGKDEIITARGPWRTNDTLITVLAGTGRPLTSFIAFPGKKYGANVAAGDIDGDGKDEIIAGMGPGQGYRPVIRVFTGLGRLLAEIEVTDVITNDDYYACMRHGVRVSAGDIDGDGADEIIGAPPFLHPYRTHFISVDFGGGIAAPRQSKWHWVYFRKGCLYGLNTAVGDVDGNGTAEVVAGPGPYDKAPAEVVVMNGSGDAVFKELPFDTHFGLIVATADTDGDGISEILATPGIGAERDVGIVKVLGPGGVKKELDLRPYLK
jgi:hypothetical protein